ncbi:MAG: AMP-binding protein [Nocardioidaceae bacterium]
MANQVANLLVSRGMRPGDKVALSCPNLPYFPAVYYGILKCGAVVVPLNVLFKAREVGLSPERLRRGRLRLFRGHARAAHGSGRRGGVRSGRSMHQLLRHTGGPSCGGGGQGRRELREP